MRPAFIAALSLPTLLVGADEPRVQFNRDVRPILADKCFKCHGPDANARKAELRLDVRDDALAPHEGGRPIVAGRADESEIMRRILATDAEEQMPPAKSNLKVSRQEAEVLRRWINEGAGYEAHWSFVAPSVHDPGCGERIAEVSREDPERARRLAGWARNGIDGYVLARLLENGLAPAPEADAATLIRRMSLVLTGLPPEPGAIEEFTQAAERDMERALDSLANRLLASPRFGERMAVDWLDAARYADTNGYFRDAGRQAWPWRDWVVKAYNGNMPFDQFTIEQLAGDLMPGAAATQRVATGFNRNHMVTGESGIIDEEYRVQYVADRLETTGTVWLGLTIGCCRCHDHKYDPISQREYYEMFSFFNNGPETGLVKEDDPPPTLDVTTEEQRAELSRLGESKREAEVVFVNRLGPLRPAMAGWERAAAAAELAPRTAGLVAHVEFEPGLSGHDDVKSRAMEKGGNVNYERGVFGSAGQFDGMQHLELPGDGMMEADRPWSVGLWIKPTGSLNCVLSKIDPAGERRGFEVVWQKGQLFINLVNRWVASAIELQVKDAMKRGGWHQVIVSYDGSRKAAGLRVYVDGARAAHEVKRDSLAGATSNTQPLRLGRRDDGLGYYGQLDEFRLYEGEVDDAEARAWYWSDRLRGIVQKEAGRRDAAEELFLVDYYVERHGDAALRAAHEGVARARESEEGFRAGLPKTLVMQDLPQPREAHLLMRGQYDQAGDRVSAGTPASLPPLAADSPRNRLGLARWIASPENPLTARVAVNRLWQQCFGEGLVRTTNDFGTQGEAPTHPELLDWLALRFVRNGWDVKSMVKLMVMSSAWRQSSVAPPEVLARDPDNRLLERGPRYRLAAETIRDQALAAGGLLVERLGGASVRPYQPEGIWEAVSYDGELTYVPSEGGDLWRRSVYTFWKRQAPPPAILAFDGPTRETCVVRRARTNTPLQALVLLNDETYVEAGRALALLVLRHSRDDAERLRYAFRRVLARAPTSGEARVLQQLLARQRERFSREPDAAKLYLGNGARSADAPARAEELAAWSVAMHTLLNLDETVTCR